MLSYHTEVYIKNPLVHAEQWYNWLQIPLQYLKKGVCIYVNIKICVCIVFGQKQVVAAFRLLSGAYLVSRASPRHKCLRSVLSLLRIEHRQQVEQHLGVVYVSLFLEATLQILGATCRSSCPPRQQACVFRKSAHSTLDARPRSVCSIVSLAYKRERM